MKLWRQYNRDSIASEPVTGLAAVFIDIEMSAFASKSKAKANTPLPPRPRLTALKFAKIRIMKIKSKYCLLGAAWLLALPGVRVGAADVVWDGDAGDGLWHSALNWNTDALPQLSSGADTALIDGAAVEYVPGGDLLNNSTLTLTNGASFVQTGAISWMQMATVNDAMATLNVVDGSTFDSGSTGEFRGGAGAGARLTVNLENGGEMRFRSQLNLYCGDVNVKNESALFVDNGSSFGESGPSAISADNSALKFSKGFILRDGALVVTNNSTLQFIEGVAFGGDAQPGKNVRVSIHDSVVEKGSVGGFIFHPNASLDLADSTFAAAGGIFQFWDTNSVISNCAATMTASELQIRGTLRIVGGNTTVRAWIAQFEGKSPDVDFARLVLEGGRLELGSSYHGVYPEGGSPHGYINLTPDSTAIITIDGRSPAAIKANWFSQSTPVLRLDDAIVDTSEIDNVFIIRNSLYVPNGTDILLPREVVAGAPVFTNTPAAVASVTLLPDGSAEAALGVGVVSAGSPAAALYAFWGETDGRDSANSWAFSAPMGAAADDTFAEFSNFASVQPLATNKTYYARIAASNELGVVWSTAPSTAFITSPLELSAPTLAILENQPSPLALAVSRPASAATVKEPVVAAYALGGSAEQGVHYTISSTLPGRALIQAAASAATMQLSPKADWDTDTDRQVVISLAEGPYATNENSTITITLLNATYPPAPTNAFTGAASELASDPANWTLGITPAASHDVLFTSAYSRRARMVWDETAPQLVATLTQRDAAGMMAIFNTTPARPLEISGDAAIHSGFWTHAGPAAAPTNALALRIGGDLVVGPDGRVTAGNGFSTEVDAARGYLRGHGPGNAPFSGASYGGDSATNNITYGSILNPLDYGSGGNGDNEYYSGAGLVLLEIAGATILDGQITAKGFGYNDPRYGQGASSGGSVNLQTGSLRGAGALDASGGMDFYLGAGSGGRIRVKLTDAAADFAAFSGVITAKGQNYARQIPEYDNGSSAAGTIILQTAADTPQSGLVIVDNPQYYQSANPAIRIPATHLPAKINADATLRATAWEIRNHGKLRLTKNARIESLAINTAAAEIPCVFPEGFTLTLSEFFVQGDPLPIGAYTSANLPEVISGAGAVVIPNPAQILMVR